MAEWMIGVAELPLEGFSNLEARGPLTNREALTRNS